MGCASVVSRVPQLAVCGFIPTKCGDPCSFINTMNLIIGDTSRIQQIYQKIEPFLFMNSCAPTCFMVNQPQIRLFLLKFPCSGMMVESQSLRIAV